MVIDDTVVDFLELQDVTENRRRILIVDDDAHQAEAMAFGMEQQNFEAYVATSIAEGMTAIEAYHPDLIIVDICLPDGNGLDLCAEVTDRSDTAEIPVIVLSALDGEGIVRQARAAGCQYFVRKPYDPNALLTLVTESLKNSNW